MVFSRKFPRDIKGSPYPVWEEVELSKQEEEAVDNETRNVNFELMKECLEDAKSIMKTKDLKDFQTDRVNLAIALFEKRASHSVYGKEEAVKDKFNEIYKKK